MNQSRKFWSGSACEFGHWRWMEGSWSRSWSYVDSRSGSKSWSRSKCELTKSLSRFKNHLYSKSESGSESWSRSASWFK